MSDMFYDPDTLEYERRLAAEEAYEESDVFVPRAWDWLATLSSPPAWLIPAMLQEYRRSGQYACDVDDVLDGELKL